MAQRHGISSRRTVSEIWRAFGLKPWRQDEFKISPDPDLTGKIRDLASLYLSPPVAAAVCAASEEAADPSAQPDRTDPADAARHPQKATHDYVRNGTPDI